MNNAHNSPRAHAKPRLNTPSPVLAPDPTTLPVPGWTRIEWRDSLGVPIGSAYSDGPPNQLHAADQADADMEVVSPTDRDEVDPGEPPRVVHIVGTGPMGLTLASSVSQLARRWSLNCGATVIGRQTFGSALEQSTAVTRNQAILHRGGTLWAHTAPQTAAAVRQGAAALEQVASSACLGRCLSFAVLHADSPVSGDEYLAACRSLGGNPVDFDLLSLDRARRLLPTLPKSVRAVFRIPETVVDIGVLGHELHGAASRAGARRVWANAVRLLRQGRRVSGILLDDGMVIKVGPHDIVVLAAGAQNNRLAATASASLPGLRHFASMLVAAAANPEPAPLVFSLFGGACVVPQVGLSIFGNAERVRIETPYLESASQKAKLVESVIESAQQDLGLQPRVIRAWAGTKVEYTEGARCQDHALVRATGVESLHAAIPGKMTTCVLAADQMAVQLMRPWLSVGQSIWDDDMTGAYSSAG